MPLGFIRLAGKFTGSKALLLPAIGVVVVGVGALSFTYSAGLAATSRIAKVEYHNASTICQTSSSALASVPALGYIAYRHYKYEPQSLQDIAAAIEHEAKMEGLIVDTPQASTQQSRADVRQLWQRLNTNRQVYSRYISGPAKFYSINLIIASIILGSSTAIALRAVCGKTTGQKVVVAVSDEK